MKNKLKGRETLRIERINKEARKRKHERNKQNMEEWKLERK
jgi:hypothetical protein